MRFNLKTVFVATLLVIICLWSYDWFSKSTAIVNYEIHDTRGGTYLVWYDFEQPESYANSIGYRFVIGMKKNPRQELEKNGKLTIQFRTSRFFHQPKENIDMKVLETIGLLPSTNERADNFAGTAFLDGKYASHGNSFPINSRNATGNLRDGIWVELQYAWPGFRPNVYERKGFWKGNEYVGVDD